MGEQLISDVLMFIKKCDADFFDNKFLLENVKIAKNYLVLLEELQKNHDSDIVRASIKKLEFIIKQINAMNYHVCSDEAILNLVSLSVTDYIISLVMDKHLTDPLLIARFVYIELSKVLYYDVSYFRQTDPVKKGLIRNTQVDPKKEKIFSYVVCTQWLQLYTYILNFFGVSVKEQNIPGQDHVWGQIELSDNHIIIVDATDYIVSSIDLSNAKSMSPTKGFIVLPKEYSGIRLSDVFSDARNRELANTFNNYYEFNRELDMTLGYITKKGYKVEGIIRENDIFNYPSSIVENEEDIRRLSELATSFFRNLKIPNNMDGYEIYAYYSHFLKSLPRNISANIGMQTIYVDSYSYKQDRISKKFLRAPLEYLKYLESLVYSMYYKYLSDEEKNIIFEQIKSGMLNGRQVSELIAKYEMKISEINRRLSLYYAINKLQFYDPITCDTLGIQLYEPMMGKKNFESNEEYFEFKRKRMLG